MNRQCGQKNQEVETYLAAFYCILNKMIYNMTNVKLTDSISYNFIVQMIPHHRAAIKMSENILRYTTNLPLQRIATNIITEQTKSIENMQKIQCCCNQCCNTRQDLQAYQSQLQPILSVMFAKMNSACANNRVNCNFMWEMIPHHEGAVKMSEATLQYCICKELKPILEAIITSQKRGIAQMQDLLCRLSC